MDNLCLMNTCLPEMCPVVIYRLRADGVSASFVSLTFLAEKTEKKEANESLKKKQATNSVANFSFEFVWHQFLDLLYLSHCFLRVLVFSSSESTQLTLSTLFDKLSRLYSQSV